MTDRENFRLNEFYSLTDEDNELIAHHSSNPLTHKDWEKSGLSAFKERVKSFLASRQQRLCAFCRTRIESGTYYYEIEHIVSKQLHTNWMFDPHNFCLSCRRCNAKKSNNETLVNANCQDYPTDGVGFNIINPYYDTYSDHIELIEDLFYLGKTPKGRKTIDLCNLSRYELVLRRIENKYDDRDSYVRVLTSIHSNSAYVDDIDALISQIQNDIRHFIFSKSPTL